MKLFCPHCGVKGTADDSYSGRKVKCPKCLGRFIAQPDPEIDSLAQAPLASAPEQIPVQSDSMDLDDLLNQLPDESDIFPQEVATVDDDSIQELDPSDLEMVDGFDDEGDLFQELDEIETIETVETSEETSLEEDAGLNDLFPDDEVEGADTEGEGVTEEVESEPLDELLDSIPEEFEDEIAESSDADIADEDEGVIEEVTEEVDEATEEVTEEAVEEESLQEGEEVAEDEGVDLSEDLPDFDEELQEAEEPSEALDAEETEEKEEGEDAAEAQSHLSYLTKSEGGEGDEEVTEVEQEPYGVDKEQCWECGKDAEEDEQFAPKDGRLYCEDCLPERDEDALDESAAEFASEQDTEGSTIIDAISREEEQEPVQLSFWQKVKRLFKS